MPNNLRRGLLASVAALVSFLSPVSAALNKTYPTSAVTHLRVLAYEDGIYTLVKSTYTVHLSTWDSFGSTYTWVSSGTVVTGWITDTSTKPWTVKAATWTIAQYTNMVVEETKLRTMNEILDNDFEQYMVWPATSTKGLVGPPWKGWCLDTINGRPVPIVCP